MILLVRMELWEATVAQKQRVLDVIQRKFEGTGVLVTSDSELATAIEEHPKELVLHEGSFDLSGPEYIGAQHTPDLAELDVSHVARRFPGSEEEVAEAIGTIGTHESGHLFLPWKAGHSIDGVNLMSSGSRTFESISLDHGQSLEFTDIQKELISGRTEIPDGVGLAQHEAAALAGIEIDASEATDLSEAPLMDADISDGLEDGGDLMDVFFDLWS